MTTPSEMRVESWPVAKLVPYAKNAKLHSPESTKKLAGVIRATGHWTQPIVIRETGEIIAGHGRRLAAIELGLANVPVVVMRGLTDAQAEALRLSDNRASHQVYDTNLVRESLTFLAGDDSIDHTMLGYDDKELSFLTEDPGTFDEGAFVEDITEAVEDQASENAAKAAAVDGDTTRTGEAFGFGKLTVAQGRRVKAFMAQVEGETGLKGAEALMGFLDSFGIK